MAPGPPASRPQHIAGGPQFRVLAACCLYPWAEGKFYSRADAWLASCRDDRGMTERDVVTVRGLRKAYRTRVVVDGLDLDVPAGGPGNVFR